MKQCNLYIPAVVQLIKILEISFLQFPFNHFGKFKRGFKKTVLMNNGLACARVAKRRLLFTRIVLHILYPISQSNGKKEINEIWILDLLVEIHPEERFLGGKICFWILRLTADSKIQISKSKSRFPITCNLRYICQQYTINYSINSFK